MRRVNHTVIPEQLVPEHLEPARTVREIEFTCDGCKKPISRLDHGDSCAHELQIGLDSEECVNFFRQRDYCPACLAPIWAAINKLIGSDPDEERDREYEDD